MYVHWTPSAVNDLKDISLYLESKAGLSIANEACRALYEQSKCCGTIRI